MAIEPFRQDRERTLGLVGHLKIPAACIEIFRRLRPSPSVHVERRLVRDYYLRGQHSLDRICRLDVHHAGDDGRPDLAGGLFVGRVDARQSRHDQPHLAEIPFIAFAATDVLVVARFGLDDDWLVVFACTFVRFCTFHSIIHSSFGCEIPSFSLHSVGCLLRCLLGSYSGSYSPFSVLTPGAYLLPAYPYGSKHLVLTSHCRDRRRLRLE